ncbi:hypothetical protein HH308_26945 [Gordonia sp. TBRC 11910]|uniref:PspA domain-containing protein n=1 Tax=Gordonia asplenii TaxID=2725283 RepID=A0A848LBA6_9ACTN|nr:hypothetical protein [Gordonia asplenii]NMO04868.1 hypothetical protein [Gordonia asplenii]
MTSGDDASDPIDAQVVQSSPPHDVTPPVAAPSFAEVTGYTDAGIPTFDHVRDKIEQRVTRAIGSEELANETPEGQAADELYRKNKEAAASKLDEIRKSMGL